MNGKELDFRPFVMRTPRLSLPFLVSGIDHLNQLLPGKLLLAPEQGRWVRAAAASPVQLCWGMWGTGSRALAWGLDGSTRAAASRWRTAAAPGLELGDHSVARRPQMSGWGSGRG